MIISGGQATRAVAAEITGLNATRSDFRFKVVPAVVLALSLAGFAAPGDLGRDAPYVAGSSAGPLAIQDQAGRYFEIDCSKGVEAGWFGFSSSGTDASNAAAVNAALAVSNVVTLPLGVFNASGIVVPPGKKLVGAGRTQTALRATQACASMVRVLSGAAVSGFSTNGNGLAQDGVFNDGSINTLHDIYSLNCLRGGFSNSANGTRTSWTSLFTANNYCALYSFGGFNNSQVDDFNSLGGDTVGAFFTYTGNMDLDQPQEVRFSNSLFFGCNNAVYSDKNVFMFALVTTAIDGTTGIALRLGEDCANVSIGTGCFISGSAGQSTIDIGAGCVDFTVSAGAVVANGYYNVYARGTTTKRSTKVVLSAATLGTSVNQQVFLDSVYGGVVRDCLFPGFGGVTGVAASDTYGNATGNRSPVVLVEGNTFQQPYNAVGAFNTKCRNNIGWTTEKDGGATMPTAGTIQFPHGLARQPSRAFFAESDFLDALKWAADATNITLTTKTPPATPVNFQWHAWCD